MPGLWRAGACKRLIVSIPTAPLIPPPPVDRAAGDNQDHPPWSRVVQGGPAWSRVAQSGSSRVGPLPAGRQRGALGKAGCGIEPRRAQRHAARHAARSGSQAARRIPGLSGSAQFLWHVQVVQAVYERLALRARLRDCRAADLSHQLGVVAGTSLADFDIESRVMGWMKTPPRIQHAASQCVQTSKNYIRYANLGTRVQRHGRTGWTVCTRRARGWRAWVARWKRRRRVEGGGERLVPHAPVRIERLGHSLAGGGSRRVAGVRAQRLVQPCHQFAAAPISRSL